MIRSAQLADAAAIAAIYNHYILHTTVTFEEEIVAPAEMSRRLGDVLGTLPWLVFEQEGAVVGYAYASKWRPRSAYRFSVETSVYLHPEAKGKKIGTKLYEQLLPELRAKGVHAVIGGMALPNPGSQALHEKFGFRKVAHFEQVGWTFEKWIDVGYWQLILS